MDSTLWTYGSHIKLWIDRVEIAQVMVSYQNIFLPLQDEIDA